MASASLVVVMADGAGLIGPQLRLQRTTGEDSPLELAAAIGDHLISHQHSPGGWPNPIMGGKPLTGFSHGPAGIAAALWLAAVRLSFAKGDRRASRRSPPVHLKPLGRPHRHDYGNSFIGARRTSL